MKIKEVHYYSIASGIMLIAIVIILTRRNENRKEAKSTAISKKWSSAAGSAFGLNGSRKSNVEIIVNEFYWLGYTDNRHLAYILATAWHESRLEPVRECFAATDAEARQCVSNRSYGAVENGQVYYGRGFVQLTWYNNYVQLGNDLGIDLANTPDLALNSEIAAKILVMGMMQGRFTGLGLSNYINASESDYINARRTVNGTDQASLIAGYTTNLLNNINVS